MLLPFLLLLTQHCVFLQNLSLIKPSSAVLIKSAVDTRCSLEGVVGPLREALAGGLFPLRLEVAYAEYPLVKASTVCGPSMDVSVSASAHYCNCNRKCDLKIEKKALWETRETVLPGVVVGSPCQLIATLLWRASGFSSIYCVNDHDIRLLLWWAD